MCSTFLFSCPCLYLFISFRVCGRICIAICDQRGGRIPVLATCLYMLNRRFMLK